MTNGSSGPDNKKIFMFFRRDFMTFPAFYFLFARYVSSQEMKTSRKVGGVHQISCRGSSAFIQLRSEERLTVIAVVFLKVAFYWIPV